jgi:hypothetical protein
MPRSERIDLQAKAMQAAFKTHDWPAGVPQFVSPPMRAQAALLWADFQKSRPHGDWVASDLILLAECCRLSVLIIGCHQRIEEEGTLIAQPPSGRLVQHPAVQALSSLQSARATLLTKLKLATTQDADPAVLARGAQRQARAEDALGGDTADVFGEVL